MAKSQEFLDFKDVVEKIVFDEKELEELKIAVRKFGKGTITAKQLKQDLLNCRSRITKEVSGIFNFSIDKARSSNQVPSENNFTNSNQSDLANDQLRQEIAERNELLEVVAKRISVLASKAKKGA